MVLITEEDLKKETEEKKVQLAVGEPKNGAKFNRCRIELKVSAEDYTYPVTLYWFKL